MIYNSSFTLTKFSGGAHIKKIKNMINFFISLDNLCTSMPDLRRPKHNQQYDLSHTKAISTRDAQRCGMMKKIV